MNKKNKTQDHLKPPFHAYKGDDPYIFVSYAHVDAKRVFPELIRFHNQGYNIWFDQGISPGNEWPEEIEAALLKSSLFVVFLSESAVKSYNVRNEINLAIDEGIPFISIYLEETELKYGLRLRLSSIQGILKYSTPEEEYVSKYTNAFKREGIEPSKEPKIKIIDDIDEILIPEDKDMYVFASYDKKDEELVLPELKKLHMQGLDIKCINFENEWSEDTEQKILESSLFLVYITSNSINSLIVRDEISLAHLEDIPFIVIYLEEVELKYGLKLQMASKESINKYEMDEEEYVQRYTNSFMRHGFKLIDLDAFKTTGEKYIYASFDAKDKDDALSQIEEFTNSGLNIEYDLHDGENEENLDKLLNASLFLVFISPNSIRSNIVRDEIYLALSEDIPFIAIYLSETKITTGLKRQLDSKLAILKYQLDEKEYAEIYTGAFKKYGFELIEESAGQAKKPDKRLNNKYLKEFDKLNTTTESIFELEKHKVLIILKDGTNLTNWDDVKNKEDIIYVSEDLSDYSDLNRKYKGLKSLKAIVTSKISDKTTNMDLMFNSCDSLVEISSLKQWDTSNVTSMKSMFAGCSSLEDFSPLNEWNTHKVTNIGNIFANCKSLKDLSFLKEWDLSKTNNMKSLFRGCRSITDLSSLSQWNTSNVKDMGNMFDGCRALANLSGLDKWDTSKVTTMQSMFRFCESIVDLSSLNKWNTSNVTTMNEMFKNCRSIVNLSYLDEWNISNVETKQNIFKGCESLKEYPKWCEDKRLTSGYLKEFEKLNTTTESIFELGKHKVLIILKDGTNLTKWDDVKNKKDIIYISEDLSNHTSLEDKYAGFSSLKAIVTSDIPDKITSLSGTFRDCSSLKDITSLQNWKTNNITNMSGMFEGCSSLTDITPLQNWNTNKVTSMWSTFEGCSSLTDITPLQNWNTSKVTNMSHMFKNCSSLDDLSPLSNWDTSKADKTKMFENCKSIKKYAFWNIEEQSSQVKIANDSDTFKKLIADNVKNIELGSDLKIGGMKITASDITIDGKGHTIQGSGTDGIFIITGSNITFKNTTFTGGRCAGDGREKEKNRQITRREQNVNFYYYGGAIYIPYSGSCTFINCNFYNNSAGNGDRAKIRRVNVWYEAKGGAICSHGTCKLISCDFKNNNVINGRYEDCYGCYEETPIEQHPPKTDQNPEDKTKDKRLTSEYLKEFEKLNTTTESIFELGEHKVLIILKDGTNLTKWGDVKNKKDIIYISEDLSPFTALENKYNSLESVKAIVTSNLPDEITSLYGMFYQCTSLKEIKCIQNWNTKNITDMAVMFYQCPSLKDISDLQNWDTSKVTTTRSMFDGCSSLKDITSLQNWDTSKITNMEAMFDGCSSLTDITSLQNWNTNKVTDMSFVFRDCSSLTDITPLQNWKTNSVTTIKLMFYGCSSLTDITPLQNWNTNNITDMRFMFEGCSSLTDITPLQNWNTDNVTDMKQMFKGCSSLVDLSPLSNWNTFKADKNEMFEDCNSIKTYPSWDERSKSKKDKTKDERLTSGYLKEFEKLNTTTESIFELGKHKVLIILKDGTNLTKWDDVKNKKDIIYISEDLSNHTSLKEKYDGLSSLKAIVTSDIPDKITSLTGLFRDCSSLKDITPLQNWKTNNITNMSSMFFGCSSLKDITPLQNWKTNNITNMSSMFSGCSSLKDITPLQNWKTNNITNMRFLFSGCSSLKDITPLQNWNTSNVTNMNYMFKNCSSLVDLSPLSNWDTSKAYKTEIFDGCNSIKTYPSWNERSKSKKDKRLTSEYLKEFEKLNTTTESIFELGKHKVLIILKDGTNLTKWDDVKNKKDIIYISEDLSNHTSLEEKYDGLSSLKAIVTSDIPDKITNLYGTFRDCSSLKDITTLQNWNTKNINRMNSMFRGCSSLTDITPLQNWNTKNITSMIGMFEDCSSLKDITGLQNWKTDKVNYIFSMFNGCSSLTDITPLQNWNTNNIINMCLMFEGCSSLTDITPLQNWNTNNIINMNSMFEDCSLLTDITPLQNWNTSKVTNMSHMFHNCSSLVDLSPLQNWNTKNITDMRWMFCGCLSLIDITPIQNWKTNNVTDMKSMFNGCSSLVDLSPLSNWDTSNADITEMFKGCSSIETCPSWAKRSKSTPPITKLNDDDDSYSLDESSQNDNNENSSNKSFFNKLKKSLFR